MPGVTPLPRSDQQALLLCAATHAMDYIDRISGCLDLLQVEIGTNLTPTRAQVDHWTGTLGWMVTLLNEESEQLRGAIAGEDPQPKHQAAAE